MTENLKIKQHDKAPNRARLDGMQHLILLLPRDKKRRWQGLPHAGVLEARARQRDSKADSIAPMVTELPNAAGTRVALASLDPDISSFDLLTTLRKLVALQLETRPSTLHLWVHGLAPALALRAVEAAVSAVLAGRHVLPTFKSGKQKKQPRLASLEVYGLEKRLDGRRLKAEAAGNNLARDLTALPPNELTPTLYRGKVAALARTMGWRMTFHDIKALKRKKAGAFLAVAQGSANADAGIVQLRYVPAKRTVRAARLALVGKGICFDTGGMNLKPARHMHGMHEDMEGSAVALGTLLALTELKVNFPVDCWLALAENHIGPNAYKQNDVVTAANGTSIEIMHTDAEGRMVLADALTLASRDKPALIIDYATLTGACVYSLSTRYSGAFTNRDDYIEPIIKAGRDSGERVWPFPIDADFDKALDSTVADIKQCTLEGEADHILAARFLKRFIEHDTPWIHVDLSAGNHKGGLAHIPTDITGFGVRFTLDLLLDKKVMA
jgi:leucyl aminopeptidase